MHADKKLNEELNTRDYKFSLNEIALMDVEKELEEINKSMKILTSTKFHVKIFLYKILTFLIIIVLIYAILIGITINAMY